MMMRKISPRPHQYTRGPLVLAPGEKLEQWWFSKTDRQKAAREEKSEHLLPQLRRVALELGPHEEFQPRAFHPHLSIYHNVCKVFELLSKVMLPSAFHPHPSAACPLDELPAAYLKDQECVHLWPWANPLLEDVTEQVQEQNPSMSLCGRQHAGECMEASTTLVAEHGLTEMAEGYVIVLLGYLKGPGTATTTTTWRPIYEAAHRLIYWAMLGGVDHRPGLWEGPSEGQKAGPVVMHTCHNRACLQPLHLALGSYSDNRKRRPKQRQRLGRGLRLPPWHADYRVLLKKRGERARRVAAAEAGAVEAVDDEHS